MARSQPRSGPRAVTDAGGLFTFRDYQAERANHLCRWRAACRDISVGMTAAQPTINRTTRASLAQELRAATPALLFGLRLWASVCLSFYVAFELELSEPTWAATTAAIVCQPALGPSLRKASFRMIGSVIGAVAIVILAALVRQDRVGFLVGLALWCAASVFVGTLLRNFAAYAAALAGYTAAILASDVLGPLGTGSSDVTILAIDRALETCIGIVSAGVVLALTDLGHSRRKLAAELTSLSMAVMNGFADCFLTADSNLDEFPSASTRPLAPRHSARSDNRRGDRRSVRPALSVPGLAASGVGSLRDDFGLASGRVRDRAQRQCVDGSRGSRRPRRTVARATVAQYIGLGEKPGGAASGVLQSDAVTRPLQCRDANSAAFGG